MKIKKENIPMVITALFLAVTLGFFLGRNLIRPAVTTSRIAPTAQTLPATLPTDPVIPETTAVPEPAYPININTASAEELAYLPGVGPVLAERIVAWRENNGGSFASAADLLNVEGIGPVRLEEILPYITVGG